MINLKEACKLILSKEPDKYIYVVNEYKDVYEFILLNKGEDAASATFLINTTVVNKHTGVIEDGLLGIGEAVQGDFKHYTKEELEGM